MTPLKAAVARLDRSVARLEHAVEQREARFAAERNELTQAALADHARAVQAAEGITARLSGAISRLNATLET